MSDTEQTPQGAYRPTAPMPMASHAEIHDSITSRQQVSGWQAMMRTEPFWIFIAILVIGAVMSVVSDAVMTERNMFSVSRNFACFGIMALGMSAAICAAGIDLSVGSLMGLCGIVSGLVMSAGGGIVLGFLASMAIAALVGFLDGVLIADVRLAPIVVTLRMLAMSRSVAMVISNSRTRPGAAG